MKKRILSILLCLCMALSLLPMSALAAEPGVSIGAKALESGKYYTVSGDSATELDSAPEGGGYLHYMLNGSDATLEVAGDVSFTSGASIVKALHITGCELTLTGNGNLNLAVTGSHANAVYCDGGSSLVTKDYSGNLSFTSSQAYAIYQPDVLTLKTTGALKIIGGANGNAAIGQCAGNITLKGSTVDLRGGYQLIATTNGNISITADTGDLTLSGSDPNPLLQTGSSGTGKVTLAAPNGGISVKNTGSGVAVYGDLSADAGGNVTVESTSHHVVTGIAVISADGDVAITSEGSGTYSAVVGTLTVSKAKNVTVTNVGSNPTIGGAMDITAHGNVSIKNTGSGMAAGNNLMATSKNGSVTVEGKHVSAPAISGTATITAAKDITITSASAIDIGGSATLNAGGFVIRTTSAGTTTTKDGTQINASYGGDVGTTGLNLSTPPAVATYYKAGDGYILFTPPQGGTPAELLLHNADMDVQKSEHAGLILLPKGTVNMRVSGENKLLLNAKYADGVNSEKNNSINLTIKSSDHGTLEIRVIGSEGAYALGGADGEINSLTIEGNVSVTATASGQNAIGTTLNGNLTVTTGAKFTTKGDMLDSMVCSDPFVIQNFNGVVAFSNEKTFKTEFHVYGNCDLSGFLSANPIGSFNIQGKMFHADLKVTSDSTLTIPAGKTLTVNELSKLTNNGTIVNNGTMVLPDGTYVAAIKALKLTGTGVVRVAKTYDSSGVPETWDTYTNDGVAVKEIKGGLDLSSGDHSGKTVANDGYTFSNNTLTLGKNACVTGNLTLPCNTAVIINTTGSSSISGSIGAASDSNGYHYPLDLTFTGNAPLSIKGGISGGTNGDTVTVQGGAQVTVGSSVFLGASGGADGTLNVTGAGTALNIQSDSDYGVSCDTVNVQNGAHLTAKANGTGSMGVEALSGGVNVTGGATLTTGCDYGVYIEGGKLEVDSSSKLVTNGAVAPFCIVDTASSKVQDNVLSLPGTPEGTAIKSVTGTMDFNGKKHTYWSLTGGDLNVVSTSENSTPVTLTGAKTGTLTFVKASSGDNNNNNNGNKNSGGGGSGGSSGSVSYTLNFETNGGSNISSISKDSGSTLDLASYKPTREGYDFSGWYSDQALTEKVTSVKLTKNATVYANWTEKTEKLANPFADVAGNAYYHDAVLWAVQKNVTSGTSNTAFNPDMICTRAQMVAFLWRAMGSPEQTSANCPFTDVSKDAYYYKAVLWAVEKGITAGVTETSFSPDATVSRGQSVTFLWRAAGRPAVTSANPFTDVSKDAYYYNAMLWAVEKGITQGTSSATFSPSASCTRSQIVTFLYRYTGK